MPVTVELHGGRRHGDRITIPRWQPEVLALAPTDYWIALHNIDLDEPPERYRVNTHTDTDGIYHAHWESQR